MATGQWQSAASMPSSKYSRKDLRFETVGSVLAGTGNMSSPSSLIHPEEHYLKGNTVINLKFEEAARAARAV